MDTTAVLDLLDQRGTVNRALAAAPTSSGATRQTFSLTVVTGVACSVQRASGRQVQTDAGLLVDATFKALVPFDTDVVTGDRLVVDGVTYDVLLVHRVTNLLPHLELSLAVSTPGVG